MNGGRFITPLLVLFMVLFAGCSGKKQTESTPAKSSTAPSAVAPFSPAAEFDLQFIDAMRKHHEAAVEMATLAATKAEDKKIRSMATAMAADQQKEIAQLTAWRDQWFPGAAPADVSKLPGASSMNMDMSHMQTLRGHQFDMMFVDMMIPHHEGAVTMSCEAHKRAGRDEIKRFALEVIRKQEKEISELSVRKQSMNM